jgi:serine/threonine-protein kinase
LANDIHGPQHPNTIAVRRQMAAVHIDLGRFDEAEEQIRKLHDLTIAAQGPAHRESASSWNSLGILAWERGDAKAAIERIGRAVDIWRGPDSVQQLPGGLFNYGMVLHSAGREDEALAALNESRRLRAALFGASHPLVGDTDRMIGEVLAAKGDGEGAMEHFDLALKLTRVGYGSGHPRTLFAELSLARYLAKHGGSAEALAQLDALAKTPGDGSEAPKLRWRARTYAAEIRCGNGERDRAKRDLDALIAELRVAQPNGGLIPREAEQLRMRCG